MIVCNLSTIMAKHKIKISKLSADTGISRTTLTALYYGSGKGIQFDTADTLCIYFGIGLEELFTVLPFTISVQDCYISTNTPETNCWAIRFECMYCDRHYTEFPILHAVCRTEQKDDILLTFDKIQPENSQHELDLLAEAFSKAHAKGFNQISSIFIDSLRKANESQHVMPDFFLGESIFHSSFVCDSLSR